MSFNMPDVPDLIFILSATVLKLPPACRANVDRLLLNLDIKTSGYKHVLPVRLTFALREQR